MTMRLAVFDAANNSIKNNSTTVITLKESGIQYQGKIDKRSAELAGPVHMRLAHGGWVTIDNDEIAAVESKP